MDNMLLSFWKYSWTFTFSLFLRSKCFSGTSNRHIHVCQVEALRSLPTLNLLDKFVVCALFVCACIRFIPRAGVFVKSFQCLCFSQSMFVFGISAVLIAGDANSDSFKASSLFSFFFSSRPLWCKVNSTDGHSVKFLVGFSLKHLDVGVHIHCESRRPYFV